MEQATDREIHYDGAYCHLAIQQFPPGVVVLKISGSDVGEFGKTPMLALNHWLTALNTVNFFIDARDVRGASIEVSGEWARWMATQKSNLRTVTMLTGSRFIQVTAEFVRRFAGLEGKMRICTEPDVFDRVLAEALGSR